MPLLVEDAGREDSGTCQACDKVVDGIKERGMIFWIKEFRKDKITLCFRCFFKKYPFNVVCEE